MTYVGFVTGERRLESRALERGKIRPYGRRSNFPFENLDMNSIRETRLENSASGAFALEKLPSVKARTGLSRSTIYQRVQNGGFPTPIKLGGRSVAWSSLEIDKWIASRIAERDARLVA